MDFCHQLQQHNITGQMINWIRDFLTDRHIRVGAELESWTKPGSEPTIPAIVARLTEEILRRGVHDKDRGCRRIPSQWKTDSSPTPEAGDHEVVNLRGIFQISTKHRGTRSNFPQISSPHTSNPVLPLRTRVKAVTNC